MASGSKGFRYYRILAVGLKFAGLFGVMAPNAQGQGQVQKTNAPAPGAFSGGTPARASQGGAEALPRGRDWRVERREYNGREFYNLVVRPGMRSILQILEEALPKVHEWISQQPNDRLMVSYTMFVGKAKQDRRTGKTVWPKVVILVGRSGIAVQIPNAVIIGRIWDLLTVAKRINAKISPYDFSDAEDSGVDNFNPPDMDSE
jgi:hypothetical protein